MANLSVGGVHPGAHSDVRLAATFEVDGALRVARNLGILASRLPIFQQRAVGTLRRRVFTEARRDIQAEYNIGAQRVNKDLRTAVTSDGVTITGYFRGIGLRNFGARDLKTSGRGVSYSVFLGRRQSRSHSFFVNLFRGKDESANEHVAHREGEKKVMTAGRYKGKLRQPLVTDYGPTVAQMLRKGRRPERLAEFARGVLRDDIERQIEGYAKGRPIPGADN